MLLDEGLHVHKLEPDHGPRPLALSHARNLDARKLPPLRQLVNKRQTDLQNPFNIFCVKQLHFSALNRDRPFLVGGAFNPLCPKTHSG
jgi:hypothetical protein